MRFQNLVVHYNLWQWSLFTGLPGSWQFREWELAPSMEMQILVIIIDFI